MESQWVFLEGLFLMLTSLSLAHSSSLCAASVCSV